MPRAPARGLHARGPRQAGQGPAERSACAKGTWLSAPFPAPCNGQPSKARRTESHSELARGVEREAEGQECYRGQHSPSFPKETIDMPLRFAKVTDSLEDLRFGVCTGAAWANRPDNSSQESDQRRWHLGHGVVLDQQPQACRSSLAAESQGAAIDVDALE